MSYSTPLTSTTKYGVVKVGSGIQVSDGVISASSSGSRDVGYFYSSLTQTNAAQVNTVTLTNTTLSQGVTLVNNSQMTVSKTSNYSLDLMIQFTKADASGQAARGFFWLRKNGIDVPDSSSDLITTTAGAGTIGSWTYTLPMNAGDYLQMVWYSSAANAILIAIPAQAGPPIIPLTPSVRITLLEV